MKRSPDYRAVTVTPNPAIDWTLAVPGFTTGAVNRGTEVGRIAAGKGVNVAAVLAAAGVPSMATGFLGSGNDRLFSDLFARLGIADLMVRLDGETRTGIKLTDPEQGGMTDVNLPGLALDHDALERLQAVLHELAVPDLPVVLAGSLPPGVAPTFYRDLIADLKRAGCRVLLDTSGEALKTALEAAPHVVKPNVHELEGLVEHAIATPWDAVGPARTLTARGVELVVVSMGAEGALFVTEERALLARPPQVTVQSTVGAGDAMVAGLVAAELEGYPLPDMARLATAFSVHVLTHGRDAPLSEEDAENLAADVDVEER